MSSNIVDIAAWVALASDQDKREQREAVHVILEAISHDEYLKEEMIMKGGTLMSIAHDSPRFSRDIDYSTQNKYDTKILKALISDIDGGLQKSSAKMIDYNIACVIQSYKIKPKSENASFPTLSIKIGYAKRSNMRAMKRLLAKQSSSIIKIDYSFNEKILSVDRFDIGDGSVVISYSLYDLIAEKIRSILQQDERERNRRQDVFDLYHLISKYSFSSENKSIIHKSVVIKSESRGIDANFRSLENPSLRERARKGYEDLDVEVPFQELDFDKQYDVVVEFYRSLPWDLKGSPQETDFKAR